MHAGRQDRLIRELDHDPYHSKRKLKEPTVCKECSAVFHKGRWSWGDEPEGAHKDMCPACHRIHDKIPAGFLTLSGDFFNQHKDEIIHLVRNTEEKQKAEHPLQRVMAIEDEQDKTVITFTDAHLTRAAGEAIHHAYKGDLQYQYTSEDILLRVTWAR